MAEGRHSYVAFYPSDWVGGTARMNRMQRSVYFDICCYNWDKAAECPPSDLALMLGDLENWQSIVDLLVSAGKLYRTPDGSVGSTKAMAEAEKAFALWEKKSKGGKDGALKTNAKRGVGSPDDTPSARVGETGPGVPPQNLNLNQNHKEDARGASSQPKRERKVLSALPDDCPNESDRDAALLHWQQRGRADLCARLGDEAAAFRDHHSAHGKRMADWSAAWRTWYGNAMRFQRQVKANVVQSIGTFEQTDMRGWSDRVRTWRDKGMWIPKYGPAPDQPGCRCPPEILNAEIAA